jgi:tRNA (cmo5U34)-methyltransferase
MTEHPRDFSFAEHASHFEEHIGTSIPGLPRLRQWCVGLSRRFIQEGTSVVDIGCSTGSLLRSIRDANQAGRPSVDYVGIDVETKFREHWRERRDDNIRFKVQDVRSFDFRHMSLALSSFTLQFIPEPDKVGLLRRVHDGLVEGGALIVAEKVLAESARFQDMVTFEYYDFKLLTFTPDTILQKEHRLRGQMTLWSETELRAALTEAGFRPDDMQRVWQDGPFLCVVARKTGHR